MWDRLTYWRVPKPLWLRLSPSDNLTTLFRRMKRLFREGVVVWGHLIQANALLYEDGSDNCPGE